MSKLRVLAFSVSLDGFSAGPNQDLKNPLGVGGTELMEWFFPTRVFRTTIVNAKDGETGVERLGGEELRERGRLDPGAQHVRPRARAVAGR